MKVLRKIIEIDEELCDGCGQCVPGCAEGALQIVDGKARMVEDKYCDGLGACIGECPNGALRIIEREADDFDAEAVEQYLAEKEKAADKTEDTLACGCPSSQIQILSASCPGTSSEPEKQVSVQGEPSALSHWPVKIRLIPANAPFLKQADLLIAADCVSVAYPSLHRDFMKGKTVMIGCPKFDETEPYIAKFADIFRIADIRSVTTMIMDVPCCAGLPMIVKKGMEAAQKNIPVREIVISPRGDILTDE